MSERNRDDEAPAELVEELRALAAKPPEEPAYWDAFLRDVRGAYDDAVAARRRRQRRWGVGVAATFAAAAALAVALWPRGQGLDAAVEMAVPVLPTPAPTPAPEAPLRSTDIELLDEATLRDVLANFDDEGAPRSDDDLDMDVDPFETLESLSENELERVDVALAKGA